MLSIPIRLILSFGFLIISTHAFSQQDVDFHLNSKLLAGKKILKVRRDFYDPYLWVLAQNNQVYRVNSQTLAVDDYSPQFNAYNGFQFVDIAGRSKDTVFIATNSNNVIHFKNGAVRVIGTADGIPGIVNSVGIAETPLYKTQKSTATVMIGTNNGFRLYDSDTETIMASSDNGNSRVYEATYRTEVYKDSSAATSNAGQDTVGYQPVVFKPGYDFTVVSYLWEGGHSYGYNPNTAVVVYDAINGYNEVFSNLFWGNSKGMFQNYANYSNTTNTYPGGHYLDNINVNKITTIYGLTSFGSGNQFDLPGLVKQNLLIGTDTGFYFSSSIYSGAPDPLRKFSLFHDDELGNVKINDICVNMASTSYPICEDGVWLAADDGLYLVKPDYAAYLNSQNVKAIRFQNKADTLSAFNLCSGDSIKAVINPSGYSGKNYQWYKDGAELPGASNNALTIVAAGDYFAVVYDPCEGIHMNSNHLTVNITTGPVFSFNYLDKLTYCDGTPVRLQATGSISYRYRWYKDNALTGDTTTALNIVNAGTYRVEVSACQGSWVPSKAVEVDFIKTPIPVIKSNKAVYCIGDNATLAVNVPLDTAYTINWYRDNTLIAADQNLTSISTVIPGNYVVTVTRNKLNCSQFSTVQVLQFNPPPTVAIEKIVKTTLCDGQTVDLKVSSTGGAVQWSTGETSSQIGVTASGTYKATVTSQSGCIADTNITVQFFPNPTLNIKDTSLCTFTRQTIELAAPPGFSGYSWNNGISTAQTYSVNSPQTISLTVTDANGCTATQQIIVASKCSDVHIPNTFTPNGDGMNDWWVISGLENDPTVSVRVYNRYGNLLYESKGYSSPWGGTYQGNKLPAGVYYYTISAKNNRQKFSGSVTIIY